MEYFGILSDISNGLLICYGFFQGNKQTTVIYTCSFTKTCFPICSALNAEKCVITIIPRDLTLTQFVGAQYWLTTSLPIEGGSGNFTASYVCVGY